MAKETVASVVRFFENEITASRWMRQGKGLRMGKANDCRTNVLLEAIQIAGLDEDQMSEVIDTLGTNSETVNNLTIEKLRLLLLNALEVLNADFSDRLGGVEVDGQEIKLKH